jgi:hypothetical protein
LRLRLGFRVSPAATNDNQRLTVWTERRQGQHYLGPTPYGSYPSLLAVGIPALSANVTNLRWSIALLGVALAVQLWIKPDL